MAASSYSALSAHDSDEVQARASDEAVLIYEKQAPSRPRFRLFLPWIISLGLFLVVIFQHATLGSVEHNPDCIWKPGEIKAARRQIPLKMQKVKFTGGLNIVDGVGLVREIDPTLPAYVGTPSPEIDAAWNEIIFPLNVFVTEKELEGDRDGTTPDPETGLYVAMPQGFHDLHCLNMIRKRLYIEHYDDMAQMNRTTLDAHIEHCIDSLRQSLMCTGDMTHIRTYWIEKRKRMMADFDNYHMCRDFGALKRWLRARSAEDEWRESADRLLMGTP